MNNTVAPAATLKINRYSFSDRSSGKQLFMTEAQTILDASVAFESHVGFDPISRLSVKVGIDFDILGVK